MPRTSLEPADAPPRAGLLAAGVPVPLDGVSIDAAITGDCARVSIAQRYRNREAQPIEAVYVFPMEEGAAVCGFEAVSNGVHYIGQVKPRDEAFRDYDNAMLAGHRAYLLDEERSDVFTASVGNLPPGAEVLIRITYVTELTVDGTALRFAIPTTVSPRYAPSEDTVGVGRPPSEALNPPVAWRVPYGLDLSIALEMPGTISKVASPSHAMATTLAGTRAQITFAQTTAALDRDIVLLVEAEGLQVPHAIVERAPDGASTAAIVLQPSFDVEQAPAEVIFVVDRSGSMEGTSIAEVRNALQLCLRSLITGCRFDIVGFGNSTTSLFGESRVYDDASLQAAAAHVESLQADLGGTEILPALQSVLDRPRGELARQVVVLTDGEVTNTDAVLALVRRHAGHVRVFSFGIGAGASSHLVRGIARAGNGSAEFIAPGERIEAAVLRQFARVLTPSVTDIRVDWGGLDVTAARTDAPALFAGSRLVFYSWLRELRAATATVSAQSAGREVRWSVSIDPQVTTSGRTLAVLAARTRIRELEEGSAWLDGHGSRQSDRKAAGVREEIVRLATAYGLASRETSFVAVEHCERPVEGEVVLRRIPVALTSGWGGSGMPEWSRPIAAAMELPLLADVDASAVLALRSSRMRGRPSASRASSWFRRATLDSASMVPSAPAQRPLDRIVALQRADGSWDLTADLARALGRSLKKVGSGPPEMAGATDQERSWATLLALAWLEREAIDTHDEWQLLARKARQWLARTVHDEQVLRLAEYAARLALS